MKKVIRCNKLDESEFITNIDWQKLEDRLSYMLKTDIDLEIAGLDFISQDLSDHLGLMSQFIDEFNLHSEYGKIKIDDSGNLYYQCMISAKYTFISKDGNGHILYIATYDGYNWKFRYAV